MRRLLVVELHEQEEVVTLDEAVAVIVVVVAEELDVLDFERDKGEKPKVLKPWLKPQSQKSQ